METVIDLNDEGFLLLKHLQNILKTFSRGKAKLELNECWSDDWKKRSFKKRKGGKGIGNDVGINTNINWNYRVIDRSVCL